MPEATLEKKFLEVTDQMVAAVQKFDALAESQQKLVDETASLRALVATGAEKQAADVVELRSFLTAKHGPSGARDWSNEMQKFLCSIYRTQRGDPVGDDLRMANGEVLTKADYTTTTGATAGYMVPDFLMADVIAIAQIHGNIYPLLTKAKMAPGSTLKVNADLALPSAGWRRAQGGAIGESAPTLEQDTITTVLAGSFIKIANEMLEQPGVGFADHATVRMISAVERLIETGVLVGDTTDEDDTDPPSDGIINATSTNDQTNIADSTIAKMLLFISECVVDYEGAFDTSQNVLALSPAKLIAMAADALTATGLGGILSWGNVHEGIPATFFGYPIIGHPGLQVSTTHWATLFNPSVIHLGESQQYSVDLNPFGTGWTSNESWLRVFTHADWSLGKEDAHGYADYT